MNKKKKRPESEKQRIFDEMSDQRKQAIESAKKHVNDKPIKYDLKR